MEVRRNKMVILGYEMGLWVTDLTQNDHKRSKRFELSKMRASYTSCFLLFPNKAPSRLQLLNTHHLYSLWNRTIIAFLPSLHKIVFISWRLLPKQTVGGSVYRESYGVPISYFKGKLLLDTKNTFVFVELEKLWTGEVLTVLYFLLPHPLKWDWL